MSSQHGSPRPSVARWPRPSVLCLALAALSLLGGARGMERVERLALREQVRRTAPHMPHTPAARNATHSTTPPRHRPTATRRAVPRPQVRALFHHGYDNYMTHAFPADVLLPLSCAGKDVWGAVSLTLVDSLDALALLGNASEFEARVRWVADHVSFDVDETVSLFETTIRETTGG